MPTDWNETVSPDSPSVSVHVKRSVSSACLPLGVSPSLMTSICVGVIETLNFTSCSRTLSATADACTNLYPCAELVPVLAT